MVVHDILICCIEFTNHIDLVLAVTNDLTHRLGAARVYAVILLEILLPLSELLKRICSAFVDPMLIGHLATRDALYTYTLCSLIFLCFEVSLACSPVICNNN